MPEFFVTRLGALGDGLQQRRDVAQCAHGEVVSFVHLGGQAIDVDDLLVALRIPHVRVVLHHVVSDADHDIRTLEGIPGEIVRFQPDGAERQGIPEGHHSLRTLRRIHGTPPVVASCERATAAR